MAPSEYIRLGIGGIFLEEEVYRQQREASDGLTKGFILVAIIGVLIGMASMIGGILNVFASPDFDSVTTTLYDGLINMPWYQNLDATVPNFDVTFQETFTRSIQFVRIFEGGGVVNALASLVVVPIFQILTWLVYGSVAHIFARMLGGKGSLSQTLSCTALAAGASLINLVKIVPFAQSAGVLLLSLMASYIAIREAHHLSPKRAFGATLLGPLLLVVLVGLVSCIAIFILTASQ